MKLITLNVEGQKHYATVESFLAKEKPDVVCLQEAEGVHQSLLETYGYKTAFLSMSLKQGEDGIYEEGLVFGSKHPFTSKNTYYYEAPKQDVVYTFETRRENGSCGYIMSEVDIDGSYILFLPRTLRLA